MVKRWVIRGVFMLPILLCACGWVESSGHYDAVFWVRGRGCVFISDEGIVSLVYVRAELPFEGWCWQHTDVSTEQRLLPEDPAQYGGFGYGHEGSSTTEMCWVSIHYYFPLFLFSVLLVDVWGKTRARQVGAGVPGGREGETMNDER